MRPDEEQRAALRVSDLERERAVDELAQHYADGRLSTEELAERTQAAYQARSHGELERVLAELPALVRRASFRRHVALYAVVNAFLVAVWLLTRQPHPGPPGQGAGAFWPIWPILIWGFALTLKAIRREARSPARPRALRRGRY
jgi:hypothetical protein